MKFYKLIFALTCVLFLISSCTETISKGKIINASGFVTDTIKKKHVPGVKVYLVGGTSYNSLHAGGWDWMRAIDSAFSDRNGNFSFHYSAEGESEDYAISIEKTIRNNDATVTNDGYPVYAFNKVSEIKDKAIYVRELNPVKLHLKVIDNPYDTLIIDVYNYTNSRKNYFVIGKNVDTTLVLNCLVPLRQNLIYYQYTYFKEVQIMRDSRTSVTVFDSLFPGLADTGVLNRTLRPAKELESASPYAFTIAGKEGGEISLDSLKKNNKLIPNDSSVKITSFAVSLFINGLRTDDTGLHGPDALNKQIFSALSKTNKTDTCSLYFDNVEAIDKKGKKFRLNDLSLKIKK